MNPVSKDMKDLLVSKGIGVAGPGANDKWGISIAEEPAEKGNQITVYDVPGTSDKSMTGDSPLFHSAFQIRVRAKKYVKCYEKCEECRTTLDRFTTPEDEDMVVLEVGEMKYRNVIMENEPTPLGKDTNGFHIFVVNGIGFRQKVE